ncbi:flavodoxin [Desulfosporosinus sp. PR]|uniref:flavodoxin n=1 Tax=Candidatus Desulfosporosinus nitrosoreducens TaxID=3401928 RepID=UPI0027F057D8|nr:flavodoxin [Desulfosporosinus sp. PR]MDQ7092589.1 flavodoxin [Desulfosporosinus sp. PR]
MKKVILINGSPRLEEKTASAGFLARVDAALNNSEFEKFSVNVRQSLKNGPEPDYAKLLETDAVIFAFPLYYFCLPGLFTRFLEDYEKYCREHAGQKKPAKVYALVNCGFPEPEINAEAVRVIGCFSRHIGARFRFGILIGGGPMISSAEGVGPVKKAYAKLEAAIRTLADDLHGEATQTLENVLIQPNFPRRLYFFMGGMGWKQQAKKNGLKKADLYRRPYQRAE